MAKTLETTVAVLFVALFGWAGGKCCLAVQDPAQTPTAPEASVHQDYYDIGDIHRQVTTDSPAAQLWFDRGLAMCYGFNHEEAIRCFRKSLMADPKMSMAYWGLAYAMGPNINNMEIPAHQIAQARFALDLAELHWNSCSEVEKGLIAALGERYQTPVPELEQRIEMNTSYAEAMRKLRQEFPDDPTVAALFAESLMNLRPWDHWTKEGTAAEETPEILQTLEAAMEQWPEHPALCHLYIHAMEASPHPEKALPAANRLRGLVPGSGHLIHMPTHIDVLVGDYEQVIQTNLKAIQVDQEFVDREGVLNFYTLYRIHNYHFVVYGAMFDGQSELAMKTARELVRQIPPPMLQEQTDFLDAFVPMPLHVMIRFGRWEDILKEPQPAESLPMTTAVWHYARAIAFAATEQVAEAEAEQRKFTTAVSKVPETSFLFNNSSLDILKVAAEMIAGEIEYRRGNYDVAFKHLRQAVELDDALHYDEPWGWMQPARHALGALLLEQRQFAEAEQVYRADLQKRPHNPWSLHGLTAALTAQGKSEEAAKFLAEFERASSRSDIQIDRSCFCKLKE